MDQVTLLSVALEGLTDAVRVVEEPLVTLDEPEMEIEVTGVDADLTVTVPHPFHREFLKKDAENQFPSLWTNC